MSKKIRVPVAAKWDPHSEQMIPYIWEYRDGKESKPVGKTTKKKGSRRTKTKE